MVFLRLCGVPLLEVKMKAGRRVEQNSEPEESRRFLRGGVSLIVVAALVFILLVWLPAYRWFFLGSLGIGIMVAAILYFWNKHRPVKEEDIENKRPLGLG
jgi:hypothetical protein